MTKIDENDKINMKIYDDMEDCFMKFIKGLGISFILSIVFSVSGATAAVYQSYAGFKLPAYGGTIDAGTLTKFRL